MVIKADVCLEPIFQHIHQDEDCQNIGTHLIDNKFYHTFLEMDMTKS